MNEVILPRKRWQQIFNVQMIFALIVTILEMIPIVFLCLVIGLNFYVQFKRKNPSKLNHEITRWINLWLFNGYFIDVWLATGNYLLLFKFLAPCPWILVPGLQDIVLFA